MVEVLVTFPGLVGFEVAEGNDLGRLERLDGEYANDGLRVESADMVAGRIEGRRTWTQSRKKLRLKPVPERTYLLVTVIKMEEPQ